MPEQHRPFAGHPCATNNPQLVAQARTFLALAIGDSTRQTYESGVKSYLAFVEQHNVTPAFPASPATICLWLSQSASPPRNLRVGTCKVYLAALVTRHTELGFHSPLDDAPPLLDRVLAGIKRWDAARIAAKPKLPITTAILRGMEAHLNLDVRSDSLLWAMMWTATAAMLRISEFTLAVGNNTDRSPAWQQLTLHSSDGSIIDTFTATRSADIQYAVLHLRASKTDPFRTGVDIIIASPTALQAIVRYISHLRLQRPRPTPSSPLFMTSDATPVKRSWLMKEVARLLRLVGHDPDRYSSHSFRKGGAVSLQERGVEDSLIRRTGRWKSDAFHSYVRHPTITAVIAANARLD
jgi:hypothetical protein